MVVGADGDLHHAHCCAQAIPHLAARDLPITAECGEQHLHRHVGMQALDHQRPRLLVVGAAGKSGRNGGNRNRFLGDG